MFTTRILFETRRTIHGALPKSLGGNGKTICGRVLKDGWKYRGRRGEPTCPHCIRVWTYLKAVVDRRLETREMMKENPKCSRCGISKADSDKLPAVPTGINHPEYRMTKSFYFSQSTFTHTCPRCHKETELEKCFKAMDDYEKRTGRKLT